jgi:hypothetical protein
VKDVVAAIDGLPAPTPESVRGRVAPEVLARIADASRTTMLAVDDLMAVDEALWTVVGQREFVAFWRAFVRRSYELPLLAPVVEGAMRLLWSPQGILKLLPRAFGLIGRGLGRVSFERNQSGRGGCLRLEAIPEASRHEFYVHATAASILAALDLVKTEASVRPVLDDLASGTFEIHVEW